MGISSIEAPVRSMQVSKETAISEFGKAKQLQQRPLRLERTELQLSSTLRTWLPAYTLTRNSWLGVPRMPMRLAAYSLMMAVPCPCSLSRQVYRLYGQRASVYSTSLPLTSSLRRKGPETPKITFSRKKSLALSETITLAPPLFKRMNSSMPLATNVTESTLGSKGKIFRTNAGLMQSPPNQRSAQNNSMYSFWAPLTCISKPTAIMMMKDTARAYMREVFRFCMRWEERFLRVSAQSVGVVHQSSALATASSSRNSKLQERTTSPTSSPSRKMKNRLIMRPSDTLMMALGNRQYTASPYTAAIPPNHTFPQGNSCPYTQISVFTSEQFGLL